MTARAKKAAGKTPDRAKRGAFSKEERATIERLRARATPAEIGERIGRSADAVAGEMRRMDDRKALKLAASEAAKAEAAAVPPSSFLKESAAWKQLRRELLPDEVGYFQEQYDELMAQFRDDVLSTERTQIYKVIRLAVFLNRNAKQQRDNTQRLQATEGRLQRLVDKAHKHPDGILGLTDAEQAMKGALEVELGELNALLGKLTTDYAKLEEKHQSLMEDLKATRKQRVDRIETGKVDFLAVLRAIATDDRVRQDSEHLIELGRLTYAKEVARLARPTRYSDGMIDQPLLNSETVSMFPDYVPPPSEGPN